MGSYRCKASGDEFFVSEQELEFYRSFDLPLPTLGPQERQRRRIAIRNFMTLRYRPCSATGKRVLSIYPADAPFPVFENDSWWSDKWDAEKFGREYDLSRGFFEQYDDLVRCVPRTATIRVSSENCDYSNAVAGSKSCYLVFGCVRSRDCLYGHIVWECESCVDTLYAFQSQWCSNCIDIAGCYDVHYSTEAVNCRESYFLHDCRNCTNCFGCSNLRDKQYCLFNRQLSRAEYEAEMRKLLPLTPKRVDELTQMRERAKRTDALYPPLFASQAEHVSGNHIYQSSQLEYCFDVKKAEQLRYCFTVMDVEHSMDISFTGGDKSTHCYECVTISGLTDSLFCHFVHNSSHALYSEFCFNSEHLFGCCGMRRKQFCILNRQYTESDYFALKRRIIDSMRERGEWGEFFPIHNSPFAYNESVVQEYFPIGRQTALERGWRWNDALDSEAATESALADPRKLTGTEPPEELLSQNFRCSTSGRSFRYAAAELEFYRRFRLPLPHKAFRTRHEERMALRGRRNLVRVECCECGTALLSDHSEYARVCCETCYEKRREHF